MNSNEIMYDGKCWYKLHLYDQQILYGQQKNTELPLEETKGTFYGIPQMGVLKIE